VFFEGQDGQSCGKGLLDQQQCAAPDYFLRAGNPGNWLVADILGENPTANITEGGFAMSPYPVAMEQG
jgi:hypothetical protein